MDPENPTLPESGSNLPPQLGFDPKETAHITGMSQSWLAKARMGITTTPGPLFKKIGRKVIYTRDALSAWLNS